MNVSKMAKLYPGKTPNRLDQHYSTKHLLTYFEIPLLYTVINGGDSA